MNAPCSGAPLTAPHVTTGGLCRWKAINKVGRHVGLDFYDLLIEGRHVGLDFYDLLIEGDYAQNPRCRVDECYGDNGMVRRLVKPTRVMIVVGKQPDGG